MNKFLAAFAVVAAAGVLALAYTGTAVAAKRTSPVRSSSALAVNPASVSATVRGLREVNYYPSVDAWGGTWGWWRPAMIDNDMARIASLGANAVRIFIQPAAFGYPTPSSQDLSELGQFVAIAASHGLRVHLTLFDLWSNYWDIAGSERWAAAVLGPFHADPRVAVVELQNEINPTSSAAMAWARTMLPVIRTDAGVPVTVSVGGWNSTTALAELIPALGSSQPDFYDDHFYGNLPYVASVFSTAKRLAGDRPLLIGETGFSTNPLQNWPGIAPTVAAYETAQAEFFYEVELTAYNAGLPPAAPWILNDLAPTNNISATEQDYGLFRLDGSAKPAVQVIQTAFARAAAATG